MIIAYEKKGFKHTTFPLVRYLEGKYIVKLSQYLIQLYLEY